MGAASEERKAKGEESLPAEGGLLKGQRQAPVIYTPNEADLIARSARLPGGISLEVDPTWGRSPWSEKGNLRPSWDYLESLYKDDPEAFDAFRDWSEKTEVRKGVTVSAWIGNGPAAFQQAMRRRSPYGVDVEFDLGEESALAAAMRDKGRRAIGSMPTLSEAVAPKVAAFEVEIAALDKEHAGVWTPEGEFMGRFTLGLDAEVEIPPHLVPGNVSAHNHPAQSPPSMRDVNLTLGRSALETRVVTRGHIYRLRPGPHAALADFGGVINVERAPGFDRQVNALSIIARDVADKEGWDWETETDAVQEGMLEWLAKQGIIHYERLPR